MSTEPSADQTTEQHPFERFLDPERKPVMERRFERFLDTVKGRPLPDIDSPDYSFCEPSWATSYGFEHIRIIDGDGIKTGGGIRNRPLCGIDLMHGWDNPGDVTAQTVSGGLIVGAQSRVCPKCAGTWSVATDTPLVLG